MLDVLAPNLYLYVAGDSRRSADTPVTIAKVGFEPDTHNSPSIRYTALLVHPSATSNNDWDVF